MKNLQKYVVILLALFMLSGVAIDSTMMHPRHSPAWGDDSGWESWLIGWLTWPARYLSNRFNNNNNDGCPTQSCNHTPGSR